MKWIGDALTRKTYGRHMFFAIARQAIDRLADFVSINLEDGEAKKSVLWSLRRISRLLSMSIDETNFIDGMYLTPERAGIRIYKELESLATQFAKLGENSLAKSIRVALARI